MHVALIAASVLFSLLVLELGFRLARMGAEGLTHWPNIACLLMQHLAGLGVPVVVLAEYSRGHWMADAEGKARDFARTGPVLACAEKAGLIALDMAERLKPAMKEHGVDAMFRSDRHSAAGNRATAEAITRMLADRHLLAQTVTR